MQRSIQKKKYGNTSNPSYLVDTEMSCDNKSTARVGDNMKEKKEKAVMILEIHDLSSINESSISIVLQKNCDEFHGRTINWKDKTKQLFYVSTPQK